MAAWGDGSKDTSQVNDKQACRWTGERLTVLGGHLKLARPWYPNIW